MPLISQKTLNAINDYGIVEALQRIYSLPLKRNGKEYSCNCPFHNERTASFSVNPQGQWYCFGCGKGGAGLINFIREYEYLEFQDAAKRAADALGILVEYDRDERTDAEIARAQKRETLKNLMKVVQEFFSAQLFANTDEAAAARQYAFGRWSEADCKLYGLGYAPRDSRLLISYIQNRGYAPELLIEAGIVCRDAEKGHCYALLRERITMPVNDRFHSPISYTARYIGSNPEIAKRSKYMNLTATPLYRKGETLYGLDVALCGASQAGHFTIVEGAPDALRLHIVGISQAVAPLGTSLTEKHLAVLKKYCNSIVFIPDSDPPKGKVHGAGVEAVMRNGKLAVSMGFQVSVKEIPRSPEDDENEVKYDADSYITDKSVYLQLETVPFVVWYADKRLGSNPTSDLEGEVMNEVSDMLVYVEDETLRELYIDKLRRIIGNAKMWRDNIKTANRRFMESKTHVFDGDIDPAIVESARHHSLVIKDGGYFFPDKEGNLDRATNFLFTPVLHIKGNKSIRIYRIHNTKGEDDVVQFTSGDMVTPRDFNKRLYDKGNFALSQPNALQSLCNHLLEITPAAQQIDILGWNPRENCYAFSNGIFADGKFYVTDSLGVVSVGRTRYFLPAFSELYANDELAFGFEKMYECNPRGVTTLHDFVGQIVKVYGNGGMVGFAWTLAAIFRDIIFTQFKWFPVLNLFGRKGSGKTELARALSSLFYVLPATPHSCTNTSIPVIGYHLSHARNAVYILDEYTNNLKDNRVDILKGLWGGTARSKMEDDKPITIPVMQGVILAGQYRPEDEAVFSRCIHLMYSQTSFDEDQKREFKKLCNMVLSGNTHLLLPTLQLRDVFEKGFFQAFDITLNDVLSKVGEAKVEDRILNNWVVALAAFRVLEPHLEVPFTYNDLFKVVVDGILYQNDQIKKSSDTANFWLYLDSMHSQGKAKEKCHFVIKRLTKFKPNKKEAEETVFVEPKRIIFLNFKAVRALLEMRFAGQRNGVTLDMATLESYLKSLPQFLGSKLQRFQVLRNNGDLAEEFCSDSGTPKKMLMANPSNALCFDYDSLKKSLDLNLETFRISEDEFNADDDDDAPEDYAQPAPPTPPGPPPTLFSEANKDMPF